MTDENKTGWGASSMSAMNAVTVMLSLVMVITVIFVGILIGGILFNSGTTMPGINNMPSFNWGDFWSGVQYNLQNWDNWYLGAALVAVFIIAVFLFMPHRHGLKECMICKKPFRPKTDDDRLCDNCKKT
jgi:hypothetical protein